MSQRTVQRTRVAAVVTRVVAVFGVMSVVAGCAASSKERAARAQLERAQAAYQMAQADPNVQTYAQLRLGDAQKALRAAEEAKDSDDKLHLGYLAERRAQIATVTGATGKTQQSMEQLRRETSDVLLQKRDRELKTARAETDTKAREAEQWRRAAEARARDAESKATPAPKADDAEAKALAAEHAKAAALAAELANLKAQQTDRGMVLTVGDVLFAAGKADIGPGAQRSIDKLAEFLKAYPNRNVLIEGHTDNVGDEAFNVKLSQQRADAVRDLLVARGISPRRIQTKGYGPKFPVVDNDSAAGRQQNRRVEVLVLNEGVSAEGSRR